MQKLCSCTFKRRDFLKILFTYTNFFPFLIFLITFPTGDLKEREKDKEVTPGSKDFCQL
ncbi:hypothetical protein BREVNS_0910 [Brevinematales bacterium NS]|nr:hypothetical protein BREVNS_0910 [Brevinematales bacterium NS]